MGRRIYENINIRGVTAEAVHIALRKGTQHRIGTGAVGVEPMSIFLSGMHFNNIHDAAAHFGVTRTAVYQAISRGRAQGFRKLPRHSRSNSKPITIGNLRFSSMDEACRVLGFNSGFISLTMRRRSKTGLQRILAAAMQESRRREVKGCAS